MTEEMTTEQKRAIWDVLEQHCAAPPSMWPQFEYHFPQCREFRFQGSLGFGGKVWKRYGAGVFVNCYAEDETPERRAVVEAANQALSEIEGL